MPASACEIFDPLLPREPVDWNRPRACFGREPVQERVGRRLTRRPPVARGFAKRADGRRPARVRIDESIRFPEPVPEEARASA